MSQEKAQLIAPEGTFTVPGLNVAGVVTGGNFVGNVTGAASSITKGSNLIVGVLTASSFVGDVTGNVTGITSSTDNLILGEVTATSMVGDFTGIASGITGGPNIVAGLVTATKFQGNTPGSSTGVSGGKNINVGTFTASSFAGDLTGNAAGLSTTTANLKLGITSATSFSGDLTGNATELAGSSANLKLGITSASSFAGDLTGNAANLAGSSARLKLGIVTATSFAGNLTGNAANLTGTNANLNLGIVTASSFAGNLTGNVASLSTNDANMRLGIVTASSFAGNLLGNAGGIAANNKNLKLGICSASSFVGDLTGNASAVSGTPNLKLGICTASSFAGNLTGNAAGLSNNTSHANLGIVTATTFTGDGSNLSGISGGPVSQQSVTANGANTVIDLDDGNLIYMTQSANTTISFTNISGNTAVVYLIRIKDNTSLTRTITWPSATVWDNDTEPTLLQNSGGATYQGQIFKLITRDNGTTWYGKEIFSLDSLVPHTLYVWGGNTHGELGLNNTTNDYTTAGGLQLPGTTWAQLGGGQHTPLAVKSNGTLWAWGRGHKGQLGANHVNSRSSPIQIPGTTWKKTGSVYGNGSSHNNAIKSDGTMWAWGENTTGVLGQNNRTSYSSPVQVGSDTTWQSLSANGNMYQYATKTDGTFWSWGGSYRGILGHGQADSARYSSPTQLAGTNWGDPAKGMFAISQNYTAGAIKTDGTLWMWGENQNGSLGQNDSNEASGSRSSPTQVGSDTTWKSIAFNSGSAVSATKTDGTLWGWGDNGNGDLGLNNRTSYSSPEQVGSDTTWDRVWPAQSGSTRASKTDGTLWAWGGSGGTGLNANRSSPIQIPGTTWMQQHIVGGLKSI